MKTESWILIFLGVALCLFIPYAYKSYATNAAETENAVYSSYIVSASEDAMSLAISNMDDNRLFAKKTQRDLAIMTFYQTLNACFNYTNTVYENMTQLYVPCILLVDYDGFYVEYPVDYTDEQGELCTKKIVTPINTWNARYGNYVVRYFLNDMVSISTMDGDKVFEGPYREFYASANHTERAALSFMENSITFREEKGYVIKNKINDIATNYINEHNNNMNRYGIEYYFSMPEAFYKKARSVESPCIISFLQGIQMNIGGDYINIYAMSGSEITSEQTYYIAEDPVSGERFYHRADCEEISDITVEAYGTMEQCAKTGANPCTRCIDNQ